MKKLILMTFLMVGMTVLAQERNKRPQRDKMEQFTPEQRTELQVKKLTLELDLNESQQKDIKAFIAEKNTKMEAHRTAMKAMKEKGTKPTSDERFAIKSKMLDEQIAAKKRMQKILNEKQFEKWTALKEEHQDNRKEMRQNRMQKHKGDHQQRRG